LAAIYTFRYLSAQIQEQQRQTDFVIGNEHPTLDSIRHLEEEEEIVLKLVNWNRRTIMITDFGLIDFAGDRHLMSLKINGTLAPRRLPFFIEGWEDRNNKGPGTARLGVSAVDRGGEIVSTWPLNQKAYVDIQVLGEKHRQHRLL